MYVYAFYLGFDYEPTYIVTHLLDVYFSLKARYKSSKNFYDFSTGADETSNGMHITYAARMGGAAAGAYKGSIQPCHPPDAGETKCIHSTHPLVKTSINIYLT